MPSDLVALLRCPNATGTNGFIKRKRQEMEGKNMKNSLQKANSNLECNIHLGFMFRQLLPPIKTHYISYKCFF